MSKRTWIQRAILLGNIWVHNMIYINICNVKKNAHRRRLEDVFCPQCKQWKQVEHFISFSLCGSEWQPLVEMDEINGCTQGYHWDANESCFLPLGISAIGNQAWFHLYSHFFIIIFIILSHYLLVCAYTAYPAPAPKRSWQSWRNKI